jgi:hypothetical protein
MQISPMPGSLLREQASISRRTASTDLQRSLPLQIFANNLSPYSRFHKIKFQEIYTDLNNMRFLAVITLLSAVAAAAPASEVEELVRKHLASTASR